MQFKQWGTQKTKNNDDKNNKKEKKSKTFLERIRLDSESFELLTEYSKHTLFCLTAGVECQRDVFALKHPPRINNKSGAEWWRHERWTSRSNAAQLFPVSPRLPIHIPLWKRPIRPGGCARPRPRRQTIDRCDCDARSFHSQWVWMRRCCP